MRLRARDAKSDGASASMYVAEGDSADEESNAVVRSGMSFRRARDAVAVACLGAVAFGYHLGCVNPALTQIARGLAIEHDINAKASIVSALLFACVFASVGAGAMADRIGRKKALASAAVALFVGGVACATASDARGMILARFVSGLGVGAVSILVPMYVSEVSPDEHRGVLGSANQISIGIGILLAALAGTPLQYANCDANWWRVMFWLSCAPALALGVLLRFVPESPAWLRGKGRFQEADAAETHLFGAPTSKSADATVSAKTATWTEVLEGKSNRRAILTGPTLFLIQQFAGINAIIYFSTSIFEGAGVRLGVLASVLVCVVNILGSVIATSLLDRMGRKPLLAYSFLGMTVCCVGLAASTAFPTMAFAPLLALAAVVGYVFIFGMGAGPVPGLLSSEIFSPAVRGKGMSLCFLSHWAFNFCIGQGFLPAVETFGASVVYLFFGAFSFIGYAFARNFVIETKGKSLEQISAEMNGK